MDLITKCAAWALVAWGILELVGKLFFIGKERTATYGAGAYLIDAAAAITMLIVAGRILGWW